jgi:hypothetical protein
VPTMVIAGSETPAGGGGRWRAVEVVRLGVVLPSAAWLLTHDTLRTADDNDENVLFDLSASPRSRGSDVATRFQRLLGCGGDLCLE